MAKLSTLVDAFTGASLNASVWNVTAGQSTFATQRDLVLLNVGTTADTYYSLSTVSTYDATASYLFAQIWPAPSGNGGVSTIMKLDAGSNNAIQVVAASGGYFALSVQTAGTWSTTTLATYDPQQHRWWRLSESGGMFTFATSPDGVTWTNRATVGYSWSATAVRVYFQTGASDTEPSGLKAAFAHINTLEGGNGNPKLSTLVDPFTGGSVNTSVWGASTAGQYTLDTVNDVVLLNVSTAASGFYNLGSTGVFDATGSSVFAQITPGANGNGTVISQLKLTADADNSIQARVQSPSTFQLNVTRAGTTTNTTLPVAYDPQQHRWWRLSESGGAFTFSTSPDGITWTALSTIAYTWPYNGCQVFFQTGTGPAQPAGLTMTIGHVNTLLGGPLNPNWPLIEDGWGAFWDANAGTMPLDRYVEVTDRTRGTMSTGRGRQYETDQVRSGEASLTLANADAALDPTNESGPWYGHINPYQPYRRRAQWPATRNMLTHVQASGGDLGGYSTGAIPDGIDVFSDITGAGTINATATAWQGGRAFDWVIDAGAPGAWRIFYAMQPACMPGVTYTQTVRVRNVAASGSQQVKPFISFYTAGTPEATSTVYGSTVTLAGSASAAWTTVTVTATAPATAAGIGAGVQLAAESSACEIQADGWQLEEGAVASAWVCPGVWYPVYAGWTERWPSKWDMGGTYGLVQPTAVDLFSLLSQQRLDDPLTQEINSHSPRFLYKLDDPAGSTSAADATGNFSKSAPIVVSKHGAGTLSFGNSVTSTGSGGTYTGSSGTVARFSNPNPGTSTANQAGSYLSLAGAGITGPTDPRLFTRVVAFRYTGPTPAASAVVWTANSATTGANMRFAVNANGNLEFWMVGPGGTSVNQQFLNGVTNYPVNDGNWHLAILSWDSAFSAQATWSIDDHVTNSSVASNAATPTGIAGDYLGGLLYASTRTANNNFTGDISFVAEFPSVLTPTEMTNLYGAWKNACAGESTDARYARILRYAGFTGASSIQTGRTTNMGPANTDGQDATSALNAVVETEGGAHFVDKAGAVQFKARSARYNATTPAYVFGERTDLGELPYEDCTLDYDSTHLSNQVTVTQQPTGQAFYATNAASVAAYFPRPMSRTINSQDANECQDAANYLGSRYRKAAQRVSSLKLHPSANPALWPVCLALELGTRVRVMRRPPGSPTVQVDCFVENLQWEFGNNGDAWLELQCSPADLTPYGVFAAWHTTLTSSIASGVTSITVNASADNTNPLAAQLAPGQQLTLGQGSANTETVTVSTVGATSAGWTTATITLTAATTKAHTAGDVVCEPLPTGVTDPTKWDTSAFDAVAFAY